MRHPAWTLAEWLVWPLLCDYAYQYDYTYDLAGNRLTAFDGTSDTTSSYDAANQLISTTGSTGTIMYQNDAAGNRTATIDPVAGTTTYTWDYENRLMQIQNPDGSTTTYTYNGLGQRQQLTTASGTTNFVYDDQNLLVETDGSGTTQLYYTAAGGTGDYGDYVSQRRGSSSADTDYYAYDAIGS
ncbi:MAG TPA: hypothetical protein VIK18_18320, partial [Pirellulales bacterium]